MYQMIFPPYHRYWCPYPSSTSWSSEWAVYLPLQAEAYPPDFVVAATTASVADSQGSTFPSQESESVTTPVQSYPSQIWEAVTRHGHKSWLATSWSKQAVSSEYYPTTNLT